MSGKWRDFWIDSKSASYCLGPFPCDILKPIRSPGLTFASLYCDKKSREAFAQLFTELFDAIRQVTGKQFKLAPFFLDANCRVIVLDGEVPQAQGLADFLSTYNDPNISSLFTRNQDKLLGYCLITCNIHFER